jgi:hypothetical protein
MVAAFFTKQTALPFAAALGLALLVARRRAAAVYSATALLLGGLALAWAHHASGGWFWFYTFGLHRRHGFDASEALLVTPARLALLLAPGLVLLAFALARARTPDLLYAALLGTTGLAASALGAGTEWSYYNALIPGVYFLALASGAAAAALPRAAALAPLLLAATVVTAGGGLVAAAASVLPRSWSARLALPLGYDLRAFLPSREDRSRGDALVSRLAATPGDVFVPSHSFYPHLAGKPTWLHSMNLADLAGAERRMPSGLVERIRQRSFAIVVVDREDAPDGADDPATREAREAEAVGLVPGLSKHYRLAERIEGPRVYSGGRFEPCCVLVPREGPEPGW